jgi:hypothetical protein
MSEGHEDKLHNPSSVIDAELLQRAGETLARGFFPRPLVTPRYLLLVQLGLVH